MFSQLIGNNKARQVLQRLLDNHAVPHVLLFHGPSGIGKGLFALEVARALLNSSKKEHPDLHILHPDPKSGQHLVATVRQLIEEAGLPPFEAPSKVFIIHDIEKMLPASSNTLLKTLEEPPPRTYFILLTSSLEAVLPTIVSRCNKIPFFAISDEELEAFIIQKYHTHDGKKIALLAQGSIAKAIQRIEHPIKFPIDELFRAQNYTALHEQLAKIEEPSDENFHEETDRLFEEILYWVREHDPLRLELAVPLITEARQALYHHVKLRNVLEQFYLNFKI